MKVARIAAGGRRGAEVVLGLLTGLLFLTFLLQITIRYTARFAWIAEAVPVLNPAHYGWTLEFCLLLWIWIIFTGAAFVLRRDQHVTFDLLHDAASPRVRRWLVVVGSLLVAVALALSIAPTWEKFYVLRLKQTATLSQLFGDGLRMRGVYSVYILFLVAVSVRYAWAAWRALRGGPVALASELPPDPETGE